jgi:type I restriction enzyme S subunit
MQKRFAPDEGGTFPEWEEVTLGDIAEFSRGKGLTKKDVFKKGKRKCLLYGQLQVRYGTVIKNVTGMTDVELKNPVLSKSGDVLISGTISAGLAKASCIKEDGVIIGGDINILRPKEGIDGEFLARAINANTKKFKRFLEGSVILHLKNENIKEVSIRIPKSIEEQRKIAAALAAYDEMIAVKTAKLETWQECKKRMVKEIFGRTKRFRDDDGNEFPEWEEKMLGEVCKYGNTHKIGKNYIKVENMNKDFSGVTFLEPSLERKGIVYDVGDVLMSNIRPYLRKAWLADRSGICDSDVLVFHLKDGVDIDSTFLYYTIASSELVKWAMIGARGTKMPRCDKQHLLEKRIFLPCMTEQQKIGSFLAEIDKEIEIQKEFIKTYAEGKRRMMRELMEG